jgi:hypothetical protein
MKLLATLITGLFAFSAFAADAPKKEEAKPAAKAEAKKEEKKADPAKK